MTTPATPADDAGPFADDDELPMLREGTLTTPAADPAAESDKSASSGPANQTDRYQQTMTTTQTEGRTLITGITA